MKTNLSCILIACFCHLFYFTSGFAQNDYWTHFRGSKLNGLSETGPVPLNWKTENFKWKTPVHDKGYSSPVVFGDQIWLTTATADGKSLYAECIDFNTGKIIYDILVFSPEKTIGKHSVNTYASPTPCIEDGFVYVHFGSLGTACIGTSDGKIIWKRTDLLCNHVQGPGSSPVLYKNLLILHYEGVDVRYIVALNKATGETVWKTDRPDKPYDPLPEIGKKAYVTPLIVNVKGKDQLISNGSAVCCAYEPLTGKEIWRMVRGAESTVPMPISENGIVYFYTGSMMDSTSSIFSEILAVNPDGEGDITTTHIRWKVRDQIAHTQMLTPVIKDGLIYNITSRNVLVCLNAKDGKEVWKQPLKNGYNASPIISNGLVWVFSVKGDVMAFNVGNEYQPVFQYQMESGIWATPAFVRNSIVLRTEDALYKLSE